ncbi:MAG: outer membrane beta-barrel protein [Rhizobiales bacterium]|nr:outer membrane beta-barrel protein [Hyphomicrobiales bacterium]
MPGPLSRESAVLSTEANAYLNSAWEKHAFNISGLISNFYFPGNEEANELYANLFAYGRIDLPEKTQFEIVGSYTADEEPRNEPAFFFNPESTPVDQKFDLKTFLTKGIGDAAFTLRTGIQRGIQENVRSNSGFSLRRDDENYVLYDLRLRGSLNIGEKSNVYLEGGVNKWEFDDGADRNGFDRGSNGLHAAVGYVFNPTASLSGEVAVGYRYQNFADARFDNLSTATLDAWVTWAATDKLNLSLVADTFFEEETNFGDAGTLSRSILFQVDHRTRDNLRLFANTLYLVEDELNQNEGVHQTFRSSVGVNYEFKPRVVLTTQIQNERYLAGFQNGDYSANRILSSISISR